MANKEATVYIVDVGSTMGETSHGRTKSNLDWALEYVWDRISSTIATGRKTAMVGVVGLRTDGTANSMQDDEDYHHIKILKEIDQALMSDVRNLRKELVVSKTPTADPISAVVIAIQMIIEKCKKLKYDRNIVLVTDARTKWHSEDLSQIKSKIKEDNMHLTVLGIDFDDPEFGFKEENKDRTKAENEGILRQFCSDVNGAFGTMAQAIDEMQVPRLKSVRPTPSYKGLLTLGNVEMFDTALMVDVERYPKTMKAAVPGATSFALRSGVPEATQSTQTLAGDDDVSAGDGLSVVKAARSYRVSDENAPGGKKDVDHEELAKGYEYGRTAVHISESDQNVTKFESRAGFDILGFVDAKQHRHFLDMTRVNMIVPQKHNEKAAMALSSLVHALYELDSYAIARMVEKDDNKPKLLLLAPNIENDLECLYDIQLPFAEDLRNYKFPPLDRVLTVSGKELKSHKNLPTEDLIDSMSNYVDSMDLSTWNKDEEDGESEYAAIEDTFSPMVHRIRQVIQHRAVYPEESVPEPPEVSTKYSRPPHDLIDQAQSALDKVIQAGDVKKVPPKARGKRYGKKEAPKPLSDLDVASLLAVDPTRKKKQIDPKNAIPEFRQMIDNAEQQTEWQDACKQLRNIIFDWVKHSWGDAKYGQAVEGVLAMRESMIEYETPALFNDFLAELKKKTLGGELGDGRDEFWLRLRMARCRPISKADGPGSSDFDTVDEAKQFMKPSSK